MDDNKYKIYFNEDNQLIIEIQKDLKSGEIINLNKIIESDRKQSEFLKLSESWKQKQIKKLSEEISRELEEKISLKISNEKQKEISDLEKQILSKDEEIKSLNKTYELEIINKISEQKERLNKEIQELKFKISQLEESKFLEIDNEKLKIDSQYKEKINHLSNEINLKENYIKNIYEQFDLKLANEISKQKELFSEQINEKEEKIALLQQENEFFKREKKSMNIKTLGNDLEKWCEIEIKNKLVSILDDVKLSSAKMNDHEKADYLFEIISKNDSKFKIILEMKSELPDSINTKTNEYHCSKLIKDALKEKADVAILVTELELHEDFMFRRYENNEIDVYWVRPYGLIYLLSILRMIYLKYSFIKEQDFEFKKKEQILKDFEDFKENILNNSLKHIETNILDIKKANEIIINQTSKIEEACRVLIDKHISTIKNKIDDFKIENKIFKKLEKNK